jgi:hypothetical protein
MLMNYRLLKFACDIVRKCKYKLPSSNHNILPKYTIRQPMLKLKKHSGSHDLVLK